MRLEKDLHTHTTYSDGRNTMEEMVQNAIKSGKKVYGISDHSYTFFDESYCMMKDKYEAYKEEAKRLKEKYKDEIDFKIGIEQDYYSEESTDGFDYVIGSAHYIKIDGEYFEVDGANVSIVDDLLKLIDEKFDGDAYKFVECYFNNVADVVRKTNCDIIGHFDLVTKYNEQKPFFDENDERYVKIWKKAVDSLIPYGKPFEINLAAYRKGLRKEPYPSLAIQKYIKEKGGSFVFSSDSHLIDALFADYDETKILG